MKGNSKAAILFWCSIVFIWLQSHLILAQGCPHTVQVLTANKSRHSYTIDQLSGVLENCTNETISVQLEVGVHHLHNTLRFSSKVRETEFFGETYSNPSIIQCHNEAGILFNNQSMVNISNVLFKNCTGEAHANLSAAAILLSNIEICSLENVSITGSEGNGHSAQNCANQSMVNCNFTDNEKGTILTATKSVTISNTFFRNEGLAVTLKNDCTVTINNSHFTSNNGKEAAHLHITGKGQMKTQLINIINSNFDSANGPRFRYGVKIDAVSNTQVSIQNSVFKRNKNGLQILHAKYVHIENCLVEENNGIALTIRKRKNTDIQISNTKFHGNLRGGLNVILSSTQKLQIHNCSFLNNSVDFSKYGALRVEREQSAEGNNTELTIEESTFENNIADNAALIIINMKDVTLKKLTFQHNRCTGIEIVASIVKVESFLNMVNNSGGAISIQSEVPFLLGKTRSPQLILRTNSKVNLTNNTATFGGGIFVEKQCPARHCFVRFEDNSTLYLSGNVAERGGDAIYGGCLSSCNITSHSKVNITDEENIFWDFVTSENHQSQSTFTEYPNKVVFCNGTNNFGSFASMLEHSSNKTLTIYKGQRFNVSLMATGNLYQPSAYEILYKLNNTTLTITEEKTNQCKNYEKACTQHWYSIEGKEPDNESVVVEFSLSPRQLLNTSSSWLHFEFIACPPGLQATSEKTTCECLNSLHNYSILCNSSTPEFQVPTLIWVGVVPDQGTAVHKNCILCDKSRKNTTIRNITLDSDRLCINNRIGILCGSCPQDYSLLFGGYECGLCSGTKYKAVLIILLFGVAGIILVALLFILNLTVSTGKINGLIFYCDILYFHSNNFILLTTRSHPILKHTIKFLGTFLAWMNLDFGIVTCFFDGYNMYLSTWMQFLFPLYIWLLVLLIILASRYSAVASRLTASNTVPVLATLLLLSYAKLLETCISAVSVTRLHILDSNSVHKVWQLDGNVIYLHGRHIPLFVMSTLTLVVYIVPFTLLLLLGPVLLGKSGHKLLNWLNRLKPFFDAFYGPYTSRYRYWTGILLLMRMAVFVSISAYSLDNGWYQPMVSAISSVILFTVWIALSTNHQIYTNRYTNYLELFFHVNLALFSVLVNHPWQTDDHNIWKLQLLGAAMGGSAFIVFCGIVMHAVYQVIITHKSKIKKILHPPPRKITTVQNVQDDECTASNSITHSHLEMKECISESIQLREPLLNDQ